MPEPVLSNEAPQDADGQSVPQRPLAKHLIIGVLTALFAFIGLGSWALASPVGAAPDDDYHLVSIWCALGDREGLCAPGEEVDERVVTERLVEASLCFAYDPEQSAECNLNDTATVSTKRGNFEGAYPPLFYSTMGVFASPNIDVSTISMRLFNAALFVGAVTALLALLRPGQRGPLIWTFAATMVPLGVFIIPSVNPSSWAVLGGLTVWLAAYGFFTAETRWRRIALGALAIILGVMAAGARGDSAVFVAFAGLVAAILTFEKTTIWLKRAALSLGLMVIGIFFFFTANQATSIAGVGLSGTGDGGGTSAVTGVEEVPVSRWSSLIFNFIDLPWLWTGGTGTWALGWHDMLVPQTVWVFGIGLIFVMVFWGLRTLNWQKSAALAMGLAGLVVIPLYILFGKALRVGEWVQPRYLLPLLIIFLGVALFGFARDHLGFTRLQTGLMFAMATAANSLALRSNMRRYITGTDGGGFNLNAEIEWWWNLPIQPMTVWVVGSLAFGLMMAGIFLYLYAKGERPGLPESERGSQGALPASNYSKA